MARQKGDGRGRLGGRKKGTPNKVTSELREVIKDFVTENFDQFKAEWKEMDDPRDKCEIYVKMCNFVLPKLSSVEMDAKVEDTSYQDELDALSTEPAK